MSTNPSHVLPLYASCTGVATGFAPLLALCCFLALPARAQVSVLTYHNDNTRMGQNTNETSLTPANVNTNSFGLVLTRAVDDQIYAQPLVAANVAIPGKGTHNLVIVVTVNDSIYAFDADDASVAAPYWQTNFLGPNAVAPRNTDMTGACGGNYQDFHGNMGIIATPVIDAVAGTIYVLERTKEFSTTYVQRFHALDLATGANRSNSPVIIAATYPGNGSGNVGGVITFGNQKQNPRPGLALVNGIVYAGWASHCDWGPYHGWLIGYNATNLQRVAVYNSTPYGSNGGIWQAGCPPAADAAGNLYFETGNGTFSTNFSNNASNNFGDTILKLSTTNGLAVADYFTPYNQASLESADTDLGSSGAALLPDSVGSVAHPHLLAAAGKEGRIYVIDRDNMGHFHAGSDSQIVQSIASAIGAEFGVPAYFNNTLYFLGSGDVLKAFRITNAVMSTSPISQGPTAFGFPGATASVSANGTNNGIVWALQNDAWSSGGPAVLHAYNATNVAIELYNSNQAGTRDNPSGAVKFSVPTVANGKVYVGGQTALAVFANATFVNAPTISPNGGVFTNSVTVTLSDTTPGASIYYTRDSTTPTTDSTLYGGSFVLTNSTVVKAKAFKAGSVASSVAGATFVSNLALGTGTGLTGAYYSNHYPTNAFSGSPNLTRVDATVNFDWSGGSPDVSITADHFTVRWTGDVQPLFSETYMFYTRTDDGARLWVNNQLLIDKWVDQGATEWSGTIALAAGVRYAIEMDYYENGGAASAQLSWSGPSTTKQIIPASQLYPTNNIAPVVYVASPVNGSSFAAVASITLSAQASDADGAVTRVDYYSGTTFLGSATNNPYYLTVNGLAAGSYNFTARATDNSGASSTSGPVNITVTNGSGVPYGLTSRAASAPYLNMPTTFSGSFPAKLSQTGAFADTSNLTPDPRLVPYSVIVPFWSDGAVKTRWLVVPNDGAPYSPGEQIGFAPTGEWTCPNGTVFVKHFELATNDVNPALKRRLETRFIVRDANGSVYGVTYKWRPDNSDADLLTSSLSEDILITTANGSRTQTWYYPSSADCLACHTPAAGYVLGVKTRQLDTDFTYPSTGVTDNQLRTLNRLGLFLPAIDESAIPGYTRLFSPTNAAATLEDRSRSYVDANCAQCHRPGGSLHANFDARYDTPLTNQNIINGMAVNDLGIDNAHLVVPQDIWRSLLYQRANTTDAAIKMPTLARNLVDTNGVAVLAAWINSLSGTPALAPPTISPNGGTFLSAVAITLQHPDPAATLRYTLDGTLPATNSALYTSSFTLTNTATVKAKAFKAAFNDSIAATALFTLRPPVFFTSNLLLVNGQFQAQLSGLAGKNYVFQSSTDFLNWTSLSTNSAPSNLFNLTDPAASNFPLRFYRAIELP